MPGLSDFLDEEMRIVKDKYGSIFIYIRQTKSILEKY